jgi:hypothetical protein
MLKIIVIFILIVAALLLSFLIYYFIVGDETEDFQTQFSDLAAKVTEEFLDLTQLKVWTCYSLSLAYTTEFEGSGAWPDVTLNRFAVKTFGANAMARASSIAFSPLVTDENRNSWETYAAKSDPLLESLELSDSLREIESRSNIPTVKTLSHGDYNKPDGIFRIENGTVVLDKGPGPYFPLWQVAPVMEGAQFIMFNQMSDPVRANAISSMMNALRPVLSQVFPKTRLTRQRMRLTPKPEEFSTFRYLTRLSMGKWWALYLLSSIGRITFVISFHLIPRASSVFLRTRMVSSSRT